jgi:hypothetical protein
MMDGIVSNAVDKLWNKGYDFLVDYFIISGWWSLAWWGLIIIALMFVVSYFFPAIRSFAGAIVMTVIGVLWAYWKAEKDTAARYK